MKTPMNTIPVELNTHSCHKYHYGDQSIIRDCCVENAKQWKASAIRNALTDQHPSYRAFVSAWNQLTSSEMSLVGDIRRTVATDSCSGFVAI